MLLVNERHAFPCLITVHLLFDRELVKTADLTNPHLWYPMARAIKRRIIYHAGPTNSGKTYQALQARPLARHTLDKHRSTASAASV